MIPFPRLQTERVRELFILCLVSFKEAMKLYSMHCLCASITLFNTGFKKSTFSTNSFGILSVKPFLRFLCFLPVLYRIRCKLYKRFNTV